MSDQQVDGFTVEEFARRHGIARTTAYEEIKDGRLIARRVRGRTLITVEDAREWRANLPKVAPATARAIGARADEAAL